MIQNNSENQEESNNRTIGIVDEPNLTKIGEDDKLGIDRHAKALIEFIESTSTPITIGIQGEWGSGKTSLLFSIRDALEEKNKYQQIWINSWEHSLLTTPSEALLKIVNEIIQQMLAGDKSIKNGDEIKKYATSFFKGALRIGANAVAGSAGEDLANELLGEKGNSIKELRNLLRDLAEKIQQEQTNNYEKIIIYVDDLDRIEPKEAVQVLELLKNIFSVPNCVFILAIDYQVVVKGLEHKFGKRTEENEWEFRAFFDKIIQLPFMMPMGQYSIGKYVNDLLQQIGFIDTEDEHEEDFEKIISYSIGGNPRSLKRLVNSISLINIFSDTKNNIDGEELEEKEIKQIEEQLSDAKDLLLFSLVCLQIQFPRIYDLLLEYPDFTKWDDNIAFKITQKKEEAGENKEKFEKDLEIMQQSEEFNETWEKALYRICYPYPRYKIKAKQISQLLNHIRNNILKPDILKNNNLDIEKIITEVLDDTAVTSVSATDESQNKTLKPFQRKIFEDPEEGLEEYLQNVNKTSDKWIKHRELLKYIDKDLTNNYKNKGYWFQYSKSIGSTFYCIPENQKSKIGAINFHKGNIAISLYRNPKKENDGGTEFKKPNIINSGIKGDNFCAPTNYRYVEWYKLIIPTMEDYEKNKEKIYDLIDLSEEAYHLRKKYTKYNLSFKEGDQTKSPNFKKYTSEDYTYDI